MKPRRNVTTIDYEGGREKGGVTRNETVTEKSSYEERERPEEKGARCEACLPGFSVKRGRGKGLRGTRP